MFSLSSTQLFLSTCCYPVGLANKTGVISGAVYDINCALANTLKACGPALLTARSSTLDEIVAHIEQVINKSHPCQKDAGDSDGEQDAAADSSEMDWLVIDSALEVLAGLSAALGARFLEIWEKFQRSIMRLVSSSEDQERATAVGIIAEVINYSGDAITPYTKPLLALLRKRMSDEALMAKSNAVYGMGQLILNSADTAETIPTYGSLWETLQPFFTHDEHHLSDNAFGCVARMISRHPDEAFVQEALPKLVAYLPLKSDFDENAPVYTTILELCKCLNVSQISSTGSSTVYLHLDR